MTTRCRLSWLPKDNTKTPDANLATSQETARDTLRVFLGVDSWANATDDELNTLYQRISLM